jgi:hypothetical protein
LQVDGSRLSELTKEFEATFGAELVALSLHGAGTPLWWPAALVAVLTPQGLGGLHRAHGLLPRWRKRGFEAPLFLSPADLSRSLDAFPLEFFNLKLSTHPLSGHDHFAALSPEPGALRLQCERELKGKAIVLRRAYATSSLREEYLGLVAGSVPLFLAVFRGLLHLLGQAAPLEPAAVIEAGGRHLRLDTALFGRLSKVAKGEAKKISRDDLHALAADYLKECERLSRLADELPEVKE